MKTVKEITKELQKLKDLYCYTNDATALQKDIYNRMKVLEWVLEDSEDDTTTNKQTNN
jgi:hypothetical protein